MKRLFVFVVSLVACHSAFAAPCSVADLTELQNEVGHNLSLNQDVILGLLNSAAHQQYQCDERIEPFGGGSMATCGDYDRVATIHLRISSSQQQWNLTLERGRIECTFSAENLAYLRSISTSYGQIQGHVLSQDKIIGQTTDSCATADDYKAIRFAYVNEYGQNLLASTLVNMTGKKDCQASNGGLIEFSASALGLSLSDEANLK